MLEGTSKIYKHTNASTLYICITAAIAKDSAFKLMPDERVLIRYIPKTNTILVQKEKGGGDDKD